MSEDLRQTRVLRGGPLDGEERTWMVGMRLEVAHPCVWDGSNGSDTSLYDHEGKYLHSSHCVLDETGVGWVLQTYYWWTEEDFDPIRPANQ